MSGIILLSMNNGLFLTYRYTISLHTSKSLAFPISNKHRKYAIKLSQSYILIFPISENLLLIKAFITVSIIYYQYYYQANDTTFVRKKPSEAGVYFDIQWDVEPVAIGDNAGFWIFPSLDTLVSREDRWILWLLLLLVILTSYSVIQRNKNKYRRY